MSARPTPAPFGGCACGSNGQRPARVAGPAAKRRRARRTPASPPFTRWRAIWVHARRARALLVQGPGSLRRLRRLGWRPRRPGARQPRQAVAGRARARGSRPRARARAARPAPRVQRPRRRAPRRRRPSRGPRPAAGRRRRRAASAAADLCAEARRGAATTSPASGAVRPRKGAARPCKRLLLRGAAGSSVSPTARHAARRIIEGARIFCGVIVGVNPLRTVGTARVAMGLRFFRAECCGRVRTPGTDPRGEG